MACGILIGEGAGTLFLWLSLAFSAMAIVALMKQPDEDDTPDDYANPWS